MATPISCEPSDLIHEAECFDRCIPKGMQPAVQTYLLAKIAGGTMDPNELMEAARCFKDCIPPGMQPEVQTYLLCQIVNAL